MKNICTYTVGFLLRDAFLTLKNKDVTNIFSVSKKRDRSICFKKTKERGKKCFTIKDIKDILFLVDEKSHTNITGITKDGCYVDFICEDC